MSVVKLFIYVILSTEDIEELLEDYLNNQRKMKDVPSAERVAAEPTGGIFVKYIFPCGVVDIKSLFDV